MADTLQDSREVGLGRGHVRGIFKILIFLVLIAEVVIILWLFHTEDVTWLGIFLVEAITLGLALVRWPFGALIVLIAASAMPRYNVEIFGWHARPEHFVLASLGLVCLIRILLQRERMRFAALDYLVLAYVAMNYFSSAVMSPERATTLRWALQNNLAVLPYFFIRYFVRGEDRLRKAFGILLSVGLIEAAYGVLCFVSYVIFRTTLGVTPFQYGLIPGTYGSQYEANLFGSYTGSCAIMFLTVYLFKKGSAPRYAFGFAVTSIALFVSLARAALLGFVVAVFLVLFLSYRSGNLRLARITRLSLALGALLLIVMPMAGSFLVERISGLSFNDPVEDINVQGRLLSYAAALENIRQHPLLGNGTASFQLLQNADDPSLGDQPWVGNSSIRILHDTGAIGLAIFLVFVLWLASRTWDVIKAGARGGPALVALFAGGLLYAISFQATDGTMLAFSWIHIGLLTSILYSSR